MAKRIYYSTVNGGIHRIVNGEQIPLTDEENALLEQHRDAVFEGNRQTYDYHIIFDDVEMYCEVMEIQQGTHHVERKYRIDL